ncbi:MULTISPECIES: retropepsin-like aspartic protease [unclassified Methylophaga]|jgi:aspartyl protease family protein|uniref:retropepsin-like aspartic protease family protein n=1 Tax=unclassified Methylophaga TaxID=2629249 RepID=UPI0025E36A54|nr:MULTISPECIES: retropepsin-like aspartic protease [unclassified Methylophaga]|tara:strand:+ start:24701 stop:25345 length:645 start_codon:yes stop_codon:yes gene_type:complete
MRKFTILVFIILCIPLNAWSMDLQIMVTGLYRDHAVVEINGQQHFLSVDQQTPEGVTLISANSSQAILEVAGKRGVFELNNRVGGVYSAPPEMPVVSIWPTNGMYLTSGSVNGFTVDFVVDTGASVIALNGKTAKRLGLNYLDAKQISVRTASGVELAYSLQLETVQLGDISLNNVAAVVIDGPEPQRALLGMSFLNAFDMERKGERMDLRRKF